MNAAGYKRVWFYPYDKDTRETAKVAFLTRHPDATEEDVEQMRSKARLRLFQLYSGIHITPEPNGFGYILEL